MPIHEWRSFFPYSQIRPSQVLAIDAILDTFESGKKFFVLEAGTGVGKSAIAFTVAKYMAAHFTNKDEAKPGCNILTTQKLLQEQYHRDFSEINSLKSSSNYQCKVNTEQNCGESQKLLVHADKSSQFFKQCMGNCVYKKAKEKFINENYGITNFSYFLTETRYSGKIPKKNLLVIDEAHNTPEELSKFIEVTFSDRFSKGFIGLDLPDKITPAHFLKWVKDVYYPKLTEKIKVFSAGLENLPGNSKSKEYIGEYTKLNKQLELLEGHERKIMTFITLYNKDNWVMSEVQAEGNSGRKIEFKPIDISEYADEYLFKLGNYVLLMSATIVDPTRFSKLCGIDLTKNGDSTVLPCPFPIENRPILYSGIGKMTTNEIEQTLPKLVEAVKAILKEHKKDKGIIHCTNYRIANYIKKNVRDSRLLIHDSTDRDKVLQEHISSSKATVLLSPSMTEGVDLKGDLSRFQILCKVPYPYLMDPLIRKKMSKWDWWYDLQTVKTVIQSVGRSVRTENDTAVTYILDSAWENFYEKNKSFFGKEFSIMK